NVVPFMQDHGSIPSVGFRFGRVAYANDVVVLPEAAFEALEGVEVLIVDAMRYRPHPTHAHLERTLQWIDRIKPARAFLTNMH
ncbi:MBL fold metallo-hydrolase, partial [Enterococcus casseliflavus]|uniref:MBL fold metallo-hydrolase n=1 Tax=Enterococcus casseliflavus TaxID=37734 RepID=UPI003D106AB8